MASASEIIKNPDAYLPKAAKDFCKREGIAICLAVLLVVVLTKAKRQKVKTQLQTIKSAADVALATIFWKMKRANLIKRFYNNVFTTANTTLEGLKDNAKKLMDDYLGGQASLNELIGLCVPLKDFTRMYRLEGPYDLWDTTISFTLSPGMTLEDVTAQIYDVENQIKDLDMYSTIVGRTESYLRDVSDTCDKWISLIDMSL